jgi:hypothetical protein
MHDKLYVQVPNLAPSKVPREDLNNLISKHIGLPTTLTNKRGIITRHDARTPYASAVLPSFIPGVFFF